MFHYHYGICGFAPFCPLNTQQPRVHASSQDIQARVLK